MCCAFKINALYIVQSDVRIYLTRIFLIFFICVGCPLNKSLTKLLSFEITLTT